MLEASESERHIRSCLSLAENGRKKVGNGAMVGAVLVLKNKIIAQEWHHAFGLAHAERALLESYKGRIDPECILYVNLEPCCHHGKTPPCTDLIIERGIKRVCFGMFDPDPRVSGKGIAALQQAGVEVIGPIARASCEYFNRGFHSVRTKGRPWIALREARTQDGRIANVDGSPLKITGVEQDIWTHTYLRARLDGILVGVETVVKDNPILNTRLVQNIADQKNKYQPWRIILDPQSRIPMDAKVVKDAVRADTIVVTALERQNSEEGKQLRDRGVRVFGCALKERGFELSSLWDVLLTPRGEYVGLTSLLIEGGQRTWQFFRDAGVVDEEVTLMGM